MIRGEGVPFFAGLSAVYACMTWALAGRKLMWNDELYTYYIARLPSMHDVIGALMARGEQTPPFFYVITRASLRLFGVNNISIRLPEMLAVWVLSACLFVFVARRMSSLSAAAAAAFPLVTVAFPYAYEARAYGLVLGFAGLALVLWQTATMEAAGRARVFSLAGLAVALAAAVSTHYYGIFVLLPFALGEAVRTMTRRRLDIAVWIAFAVSVLPLAFHLPLIRAATAYSGAFWSPPQWVNVPDFYIDLLFPALMPIAAIATLAVINGLRPAEATGPAKAGHYSAAGPPEGGHYSTALPLHEMAVAAGFIALPIVCVVIAKFVTGAFVNRYALPAVIGFALLAGLAVEVAFRRRPVMRIAALVCLGGWFMLAQAREWVEPTGYSQPFPAASIARPAEWVSKVGERDLPLVIADAHTFTMLSHYGAPDIKPRIVYLADPDRALARLGHNSVERGMLDLLKPWFHMNVVAFEPFMAEHSRFLVYGDFVRLSFLNWLEPELRARGMHSEILNRGGDNMLLLAWRDAS